MNTSNKTNQGRGDRVNPTFFIPEHLIQTAIDSDLLCTETYIPLNMAQTNNFKKQTNDIHRVFNGIEFLVHYISMKCTDKIR